MIIGLIGPKLSGKGTAAAYLTQKHSAHVYSMSGIISDIAVRLHLENSRANIIAIVTGLRSTLGEDILAQVLKGDIEAANDDFAVIDGIRMPKEVEIFSTLRDFKLIYIDAPVETRYARAKGRGEKAGEQDMSFEQFIEEEGAVTEKNIANFKAQANYTIENTGSMDELYAELEKCITLEV